MRNDNIIEGYNWTKFPFREDPITHQKVCLDCWNGRHGTLKEPGCKLTDCACLCYVVEADKKREAGLRAARTRQKNEMLRKDLESPDNPLRVDNIGNGGKYA